jgi:hypothetical protein
MPGSLARQPRHECIDRGSRRRTHRWARKGARRWSWRRHRQRSHGCGGDATIQWAMVTAEQHSAHGQAAKHRTASGEDAGVADATGEVAKTPPQVPRRGAEAPARSSRSRSSHRGEINSATLGGDGDERRRTWRIATVKCKSLTRRSKCPTWRRRSSPELAGIERRSRRRFAVAREERIRVRASEKES